MVDRASGSIFHLYHVKLLLSSLDGTLENNDLHIIVSAFYFPCLDGSIFFMRLEQKSNLYDFFSSRDMVRGEQFFTVAVMVASILPTCYQVRPSELAFGGNKTSTVPWHRRW
jgi:hypothetical protein